MEKTIVVKYKPFGDVQELLIPVSYETENDDNILTVRCRVDLPVVQVPWWLKPHKFELRAAFEGSIYQLLLNETRNVHTVDAALFMDLAQEKILEVEKRKGTKLANAGR
ncbi:hypothetical protein [Polluticoccus soli]|uniref:hypothetical protein n=1 Tax=Polluticoccus soli TaxID=3034150 RepID=UPI0023E213E1|nr:hypothetical protein [Flavipsychrobacter sp. JY13-12]